jgi:dihydroorotate dehydrogenase (fumarate)
MADLSTTYMGLNLATPLVLASSSLTNKVENFQSAEQHGAGAVVLRSLFEEQIEAVDTALQEALGKNAEISAEAQSFFPRQVIGPQEYLRLIGNAKKAVRIPVIASLNCVAPGSWSGYAKQIEEAGADGLEVNLYGVQADPTVSGAEVENRYHEVISAIRDTVQIPVAVKLSPFFSALANTVARFDAVGVQAFVLFNRFLQPDFALDKLSLRNDMSLSQPGEMLLPLRWIALLHGRIKADLSASTGIHDAAGVIKMLLAGATTVQLAAALVKNGVPYLAKLRDGLEDFMDKRGYANIEDFRGTLSQRVIREPGAFERAQYVQLILSQNT